MMKRNKNIVIIIVMLMLLAVSLSGCGKKSKLSGTYVNENDKSEKFKFSGESKVTYYNNGEKTEGNYLRENEAVVIQFGEDIQVLFVKNEKALINDNMAAFVKKGYIERNWWKWLIFVVVYAIAQAIYRRKTGRDLGEDLENFGDNL